MGLARRLRGAASVRGCFRAAPAASRAHGGAAGGERVPVGIRSVPVHSRRAPAKNLSALRAGTRCAGHGPGARARAFKARRPALEAAGLPAPDGVLVQPRLLAGVYSVLPRYRGGLRREGRARAGRRLQGSVFPRAAAMQRPAPDDYGLPAGLRRDGRQGAHQVCFALQKAHVLGRAGGGIRGHRRGRVLPDRPEDRHRAAGGRRTGLCLGRPCRGGQRSADKRILFQHTGLR